MIFFLSLLFYSFGDYECLMNKSRIMNKLVVSILLSICNIYVAKCQNITLPEMLNFYNLPVAQLSDKLLSKNFTLEGKTDTVLMEGFKMTSYKWVYAESNNSNNLGRVRLSFDTKISGEKNEKKEKHLAYSTRSKKFYLAIIKSLSKYGFKFKKSTYLDKHGDSGNFLVAEYDSAHFNLDILTDPDGHWEIDLYKK